MATPKKQQQVKEALRKIRDGRETLKNLKSDLDTLQPEIIPLMKAIDPQNEGIVFDEEDKARGTGFVQQNQPTELWDDEAIIEWLKEDKKRWLACSSRVFDIRKFEAEIANGNINKKVAKRFRISGKIPNPFIRFGKK